MGLHLIQNGCDQGMEAVVGVIDLLKINRVIYYRDGQKIDIKILGSKWLIFDDLWTGWAKFLLKMDVPTIRWAPGGKIGLLMLNRPGRMCERPSVFGLKTVLRGVIWGQDPS